MLGREIAARRHLFAAAKHGSNLFGAKRPSPTQREPQAKRLKRSHGTFRLGRQSARARTSVPAAPEGA